MPPDALSVPSALGALPSERILVLISGNGSNLQALIDSLNTPRLPHAKIIKVISNRKDAYGLKRAEKASIPKECLSIFGYKKPYPKDEAGKLSAADEKAARQLYDLDLAKLVVDEDPDLVVCAGFMHILSPSFYNILCENNIDIINLHPALPGEFNGTRAIQRAHAAYQEGKITRTGIMVHYVISEVDMGEPIVTQEVDMRQGESVEELEERMHVIEHRLIVEGTRMVLEKIRAQRRNGTG